MENLEAKLRAKLKREDTNLPCYEGGFSWAAVLILFVCVDEEWNILFTHRTNKVRTHQGEVSFPGGAYETGDTSLSKTALRETKEEIGIEPESILLLGGMDPYKTVTDYNVYPFVGILKWPFKIVLNKDEVENTFLIPLVWLNDPNNFYQKDHVLQGSTIRKVVHYRDFNGEHLWGFTARLTQEVLNFVK